jgi:YVTN family beta-propeller protein
MTFTNWSKATVWICLSATLAAGGFAAAAAPTSEVPTSEVLDRWTLGGPGGWDYLTFDPAGKRLFVSRSTHVDVIDSDGGKLLGSIPDTQGVHGIALAPDLQRGYTSNGRGNSVTAFDLQTLKVLQVVNLSARNPDAILYEPTAKHVFTFNGASKDVSVLDAATLAQVATIPVPDKPEFAVEDGRGQIFVNIESSPGQMVVIDVNHLSAKAVWPLPGCNAPSGLAIDTTRHRLFSVCDDKTMVVTDSTSGRQVTRVTIGEHPDAAAYDAKRAVVYSSNGDGTLTIVKQDSADNYTVVQSLQTQPGARTMAVDPASGRVFLVTAQFGPAQAATSELAHPRPVPIEGTFVMLVVGSR